MKLTLRLIALLIISLLVGCTLGQQSIEVLPTVAVIPTNVPSATGGFWYYEDPSSPAGYDPVFARCNNKVFMLVQNGAAWTISDFSLEAFNRYPLSAVGQMSDFNWYHYYPAEGKVVVTKDSTTVEIKMSAGEYNPQYWYWAWTSLIFIKDCRLHIYHISISDQNVVTSLDCHIDFSDSYVTSCKKGYVVNGQFMNGEG